MFDIIVFAVVFIVMWVQYRRGFERTFSGFLSVVGGLICGIILYAILGTILNSTSLPGYFGGLIRAEYLKTVGSGESVNQIYAALQSLPNEEARRLFIGEVMVKFLSFIIIFVISFIILQYVLKRMKFIKKVKVVRQLDGVVGGIIGLLQGFLLIYVTFAFLAVAKPIAISDSLETQIMNGEMSRFVYEDNYIANIVSKQEYLSSES